MPSLVAEAEGWKQCWRLGILRGLGLCPGILQGWTTFCTCSLHPPDLFSEFLCVHLCPCVAGGPDLSVLLREPMRYSSSLRSRYWSILHDTCRGILNGLYGSAMCLRFLLRCPRLELRKQGLRCRLTVFRLILAGRF